MTAVAPAPRVLRPQPGMQWQMLASPADIVIGGGAAGSGKSAALLLDPLRHVHVPGFAAVVFRRTLVQHRMEGGLWDTAMEWYPGTGATPTAGRLEFTWPSGATVRLAQIEHETSVLDYQGAQIPALFFDELTHFSARQFWYMLSRNRSTCGVRPYIRATCNPEPGWIADLLAWWIDQDSGYPIPARSGKLRFFSRMSDGELVWGATREEVAARTGAGTEEVKSLTFIPGTIEGNRILLTKDPSYLANLKALPYVERMRLLHGNWKVRAVAGAIFPPSAVTVHDEAPADFDAKVRFWDKAGSLDGDWSCGVLVGMKAGVVWVLDVQRGRWRAVDRERVVYNTAMLDGRDVPVRLEQEPGSGGKESAENTVRMLAGWDVAAQTATGDKVSRWRPFAAQWQAGNVRVLARPWTATYLDELAQCPDGPHDDQADASAGAFTHAARLAASVPWTVHDERY